MSIKKFKKEDDLAGSLSKYAKNVKGKIPFKKVIDMAWEEVVREDASKEKKITKELLKLSKHTHPVSIKEIVVGNIRKDRRRHKLNISINEAIEKAINIVAREKSRVK